MSHNALGGMPDLGGFCFMLAHFSHFFALVAHFFDFFGHLKLSCVFVTIFGDFCWIFHGFGKDLGRFFDCFFDVFLHFSSKRQFCKILHFT